MILTGPKICSLIYDGKSMHGKIKPDPFYREPDSYYDAMDWIDVDPFELSLVGPNSIDLRLGNELLCYHAGFERHQFYQYYHRNFEAWKNLETKKAEYEISSDAYCPLPKIYYEHEDGSPDGWRSISCPISAESILDLKDQNGTHRLSIPDDGLVLWPGILYLGRTLETIGSNAFVPIVEGRSSVGRLGVHVHVTAGFCDIGFRGTITLEIHCLHPIKIYPNVPICQAYFLKPDGRIELYKGRYQNQIEPVASRFGIDPHPTKTNNDE